MGKGQSKEVQKQVALSGLKCQDWKAVHKEDPEAVKTLHIWVEKYSFDGRIATPNLQQLKEKIEGACGKDKNSKRKMDWDTLVSG